MISRNSFFIFFALNIILIGNVNSAVIANLSYITPSGTASPTESIDVWVRLSLDPLSDPFTFNKDLGPTAGVPSSLIPVHGDVLDQTTWMLRDALFDSYSEAGIAVGYDYRTNNFINTCNAETCGYNYKARSVLPGSVRDLEEKSFTLNPGESLDILHGYFTPKLGSGATPGTYTLYNVTLSLVFYGLTADGESITGFTVFAETCPTNEESCAFTRTVSAVPLPATFYLFSSGLIALISIMRRK